VSDQADLQMPAASGQAASAAWVHTMHVSMLARPAGMDDHACTDQHSNYLRIEQPRETHGKILEMTADPWQVDLHQNIRHHSTLSPCLDAFKIPKFYKIPHHIEYLNVCMKY